jgi:hypothetical protein
LIIHYVMVEKLNGRANFLQIVICQVAYKLQLRVLENKFRECKGKEKGGECNFQNEQG